VRRLILLLAFTTIALPQTAPSDWPQFLGPGRDGVYRGAALLETWPDRGPRVVWRKDVGAGFAGPVVSQGHLILFHRANNREIVEAMDPATGAPQWKYDYATTYRDDFGFDEGPRAAPVIADGVVYTFGAEGQLNALELATGKRLWGEDTRARFKVAKGFFGAAGSPIVDQGRVIANIGGADAGIVAFDTKTGKRRGQLLVGYRRDDRRAQNGRVPDTKQSAGAGSGYRQGRVSKAMARAAGGVCQCRDARDCQRSNGCADLCIC
jgi:outer membrane protein assembly factor BamB